MLRGPKNMFKTISDLRTQMGLAQAPKTSGHKNRDFLGRNFWRLCLCVHILFRGVRGPEGSQRVIPAWEKLSDLAPIPSSQKNGFWVNPKTWLLPPSDNTWTRSFKGWLRFCYGGGEIAYFFLTSKCKISGLGYRMDFKVVSADTMDPSGPFRTMFGVFRR